METLRSGGGPVIPNLWRKFKPIIEMYRKTDYGKSQYENWEYLSESFYQAYPETVPLDFVPPMEID